MDRENMSHEAELIARLRAELGARTSEANKFRRARDEWRAKLTEANNEIKELKKLIEFIRKATESQKDIVDDLIKELKDEKSTPEPAPDPRRRGFLGWGSEPL